LGHQLEPSTWAVNDETDMAVSPALAALVAFVNEWRERERRGAKTG
jgi:hypothetical protein